MIPLFRVLRSRKKKLVLVFICVALVLVLNFPPAVGPSRSENGKAQVLAEIKHNEHESAYIHKLFLQEYPLETVLDLPLDQRCDLFFQFLTQNDKYWTVDPGQNYELDTDSEEYYGFVMKNGKRLTREYKLKFGKTEGFIELLDAYMKSEFYKYQALANEVRILDDLTILRTFNKCYINQRHGLFANSKMNPERKRAAVSAEKRVYAWLSRQYPTYQRWDGKIREMKMDGKDDLVLNQFKQSSSGKGVVVTIADKHADDMVSLIHILRALKNRLPIEIVYNHLTDTTKSKIVKAARDHYNNLPKQDVWFVEVGEAIAAQYGWVFQKFDYKVISILFNSFKEFILLDADTVLFKPPSYFFNTRSYRQTGAYFFKDRGMLHRRSIQDGQLLASFGPSVFDTAMFDIPQMTNHTYNNAFFKGLTHLQESGVVVLDKSRHFSSLLMSIQMSFIYPINVKMHGDKEFYWLGFSLNGDENYVFNDNFAAAVGQLTPVEDAVRPDGKQFNGRRICSTHPGHISSEDRSLLWMNTGFKNCGKEVSNYNDEADRNKKNTMWKRLSSGEDLKKFYKESLKITHAILPPLDAAFEDMINSDGEPSAGWELQRGFCLNYVYCAYTSIGGKDNQLEGELITFSDRERWLFDRLGDFWVGLQ
ncbi:putative alpha-1,3-mannosyltransferase MNN13 [Candida viswanathii]|uniref:Putative alpha-1,3-mannosyltransferase MNN13 n=1 Tax=Candida viswanathii TaxID=5486 RepID=A0A367YGX4_9ASCO|nr:putative alpha-1,3-mannosyltransferase MNN13 [Candida viswanathii]